jgi:hypothetical protein
MSRTECGSASEPVRPRMNSSALLAEKVADGFKVHGVPTSERTARLCVELGVPLYSLDDMPELDLTIDGADEIDRALTLVKGGGGALLREKIVAAASAKMIVIADESKLVETLGEISPAHRSGEVRHGGDPACRGAAGFTAGPERRH